MSIVLDLTGRTPLSAENARRLESIANKLRHRYVELVNQMSAPNSDSIDWWVTPLATRNTFTSPFFINCCRARLLEEIIACSQVPYTVIVGSPGMARVAKSLVSQRSCECQIEFDRGTYLYQLILRSVKNFFSAAILSLLQWIFANLLLKDIKRDQSEPLILVETFLYPNSIRYGKFHDRHFPGIEAELDPTEIDRLCYFPTFYGIRNFAAAYLRVKQQKAKFLFKEHYLNIGDYLFALGHGMRVARFKRIAPLMLDGIDVHPIANDTLGVYSSPPSAIEALLKYRAIKRMHQVGLRISSVLKWFENQDIDRAVNAGFRRYYPDCPVTGYVGYIPAGHYHLCTQPTATEFSAAVLPTRVNVMGPGFVEVMREFEPRLNVGISPALRYKHMFVSPSSEKETNIFRILVALPVVRAEALDVIAAVRNAIPEIRQSMRVAVSVVIKSHPANIILPKDLSSLSNDSEVLVEWSDVRLDYLLARSDLMISAASSACFEALAVGVPVIVMANLKGLTYVTIPKSIQKNLWQLCYPGEPLSIAIEKLLQGWASAIESGVNPAEKLREMYLEPVTRKGVRELVLGG